MADSGHQPSAISHQPSAISHQPSAISHQPSAISHRPSAISHQPSAISHQPSAIGHQPSAISHQPVLPKLHLFAFGLCGIVALLLILTSFHRRKPGPRRRLSLWNSRQLT
jgi:hypothetical protein